MGTLLVMLVFLSVLHDTLITGLTIVFRQLIVLQLVLCGVLHHLHQSEYRVRPL